jgi:ribosomal-protein-alanine N-acetyltransferase
MKPASPAHAPLMAELHAASFNDGIWSLDQIRGSLSLETTKGWVAFNDNIFAAFILCQIMHEESEILTFCVNPSLRGQKIGERLMRHAIAALRDIGSKNIFLEVSADNFAACKLYEKLGFQIIGKRTDYYQNESKRADALLFSLSASDD